MGILDSPALFFAEPQPDWSLGDIVIVPAAVLWADTERRATPYPQPMPAPDGSASVVYQLWSASGGPPPPLVECWFTPAVIVVDDCVIDKEFNTRTVPVSRQLLWGPAAAMSEPARKLLRWKLAQFYAVRNLSVDTEIMATLGKTITGVRTVIDHRDRPIVDLELDHGETELRLRQGPRRAELPPGHQRGRTT